MNIKPIHSQDDYELSLKYLNKLMSAEIDSSQGDELEILSTLIAAYENKAFPIVAPDPIEAIKFRMEQMNIKNKELGEILHSDRGRVSEILNRKRPLSLRMIRALQEALHIPSSVLIQEYPLQ